MIRLKRARKASREGKITQQCRDLAHTKVQQKSTFPCLGDSLDRNYLVRNCTECDEYVAGLPDKLVVAHHCIYLT